MHLALDALGFLLGSFFSFIFDPSVIAAHLAAALVFADVALQRGLRYSLRTAAIVEVLFILIWSIIPGSPTAVVCIAACIFFRERFLGPQFEVLEGATFFTGTTCVTSRRAEIRDS